MRHYYVDLHIHIGRTRSGKPVKITGSRLLTIPAIIQEASFRKGMEMIGIIDAHVPEVITELEYYMESGDIKELQDGGLRHKNLTILLGSELEVYDELCHGPIHVLVYFGRLEEMKQFSLWLSSRMKNITLSSQRIYEHGMAVQEKVKELNGLFIPAHVFTPFKSLYGKGVKQSLSEVFNPLLIDGIELGLSADTAMANEVEELHVYPFLTNSDAHSTAKIAREYQQMSMKFPSFAELTKVLKGEGGRSVAANYGLNPFLGKYYHTVCEKCFHKQPASAQWICAQCGHRQFIKGVSERIQELPKAEKHVNRPPYIHQVPLEFIPGIGKKTLDTLIQHVGTEMYILHESAEEELQEHAKPAIVKLILQARKGELDIISGGGGVYGKVAAE